MIRLLLCLLATGLFLGSTAQAQHPGLRTVRGTVASVDDVAGTFVLDTPSGNQVTVQTGAHTRIGVDGSPGALIDIRPGMQAIVRGRPDPQNQVFRARLVRARTAP